jgi:hypothetical protein
MSAFCILFVSILILTLVIVPTVSVTSAMKNNKSSGPQPFVPGMIPGHTDLCGLGKHFDTDTQTCVKNNCGFGHRFDYTKQQCVPKAGFSGGGIRKKSNFTFAPRPTKHSKKYVFAKN